jgi:hypothetical protein
MTVPATACRRKGQPLSAEREDARSPPSIEAQTKTWFVSLGENGIAAYGKAK